LVGKTGVKMDVESPPEADKERAIALGAIPLHLFAARSHTSG
jgi:hypothetical protein